MLDWLLSPQIHLTLSAFLKNPGRDFYASGLARRLHLPLMSVHRALASLNAAGVLARRHDGNRVYYHADPGCPNFQKLAAILSTETRPYHLIRKALAPFISDIDFAFINHYQYPVRKDWPLGPSLVIIGPVDGFKIHDAIRPLQKRRRKMINVMMFTRKEFRYRLSVCHYSLKTHRTFLVGSEYQFQNTFNPNTPNMPFGLQLEQYDYNQMQRRGMASASIATVDAPHPKKRPRAG